jgi:hypothetical protein
MQGSLASCTFPDPINHTATKSGLDARSYEAAGLVTGRPRAEAAGVGIVVSAGSEVVALSGIRVRGCMGRHIGAIAPNITGSRVRGGIGPSAVSLSVGGGRKQNSSQCNI